VAALTLTEASCRLRQMARPASCSARGSTTSAKAERCRCSAATGWPAHRPHLRREQPVLPLVRLLAQSPASRHQPLALRHLAPRHCRSTGKRLRRALFAAMFGASRLACVFDETVPRTMGQHQSRVCRSERVHASRGKPADRALPQRRTVDRGGIGATAGPVAAPAAPEVIDLTLAHGADRRSGGWALPRKSGRAALPVASAALGYAHCATTLQHQKLSRLTWHRRARAEGGEDISLSGRPFDRPRAEQRGGTCIIGYGIRVTPSHRRATCASPIRFSSRLSLLSRDARPWSRTCETDHDKCCTS